MSNAVSIAISDDVLVFGFWCGSFLVFGRLANGTGNLLLSSLFSYVFSRCILLEAIEDDGILLLFMCHCILIVGSCFLRWISFLELRDQSFDLL